MHHVPIILFTLITPQYLANLTNHEINLKPSEHFHPKFTSAFPNVAKRHFSVLNASSQPSVTVTK